MCIACTQDKGREMEGEQARRERSRKSSTSLFCLGIPGAATRAAPQPRTRQLGAAYWTVSPANNMQNMF